MSNCLINLRTDLLTGADGGGEWTYDGYNETNSSGPFTVGTGEFENLPSGDNPQIDTSGKPVGFYRFTYSGGSGDCEDEVSVVLQIIEGCHFDPVDDKSFCAGDAFTVDLVDITGGDCGITVQQAGNSDTFPSGVTLNTSTNQLIAVPNATELAAGDVYRINIDIVRNSSPESGYNLEDCENCDGGDYQVQITITESFDAGTPVLVAACN